MLAYVRDEPGAEVVQLALARSAAINLVNWAEVLTVIIRRGGVVPEFQRRLMAAGILGPDGLLTMVGITAEDAQLTAELYPISSGAGLSLGDRMCMATGIRLHLSVFTAERAWLGRSIPGLDIRLIRG